MTDIWKQIMTETQRTVDEMSAAFASKKSVYPRLCARCCSLQHQFRHTADHQVPREVHSWVSNMQRYYAGLCRECGQYEARVRAALRERPNQPGRAAE